MDLRSQYIATLSSLSPEDPVVNIEYICLNCNHKDFLSLSIKCIQSIMNFFWESSVEVDGTPILIVYLKFYIFFFNHLLEPSISSLFIKKKSSCLTYFPTLKTNVPTNDKNYLARSKCINRDKCTALSNCCSSETFHRSSSYRKSRERSVNDHSLKKDGFAHIQLSSFDSSCLRLNFRNLL